MIIVQNVQIVSHSYSKIEVETHLIIVNVNKVFMKKMLQMKYVLNVIKHVKHV